MTLNPEQDFASHLLHSKLERKTIITMKDIEAFLKLLAARVYTARVGGILIRDAGDFKAWLLQLADKAAKAPSVEEFLKEFN